MAAPVIVQTRPELPGGEALDEAADRLGARLVRLPLAPGEVEPEPSVLREAVAGADGVLATATDPIDADLLDSAPSLRVVALAAVGTDQVDLAAAARHGVVVTNTPGVLAETVADTAFALVLMARRRLMDAVDDLRAGSWRGFDPGGFLGHDVTGATLGILGYGEIGRAVARRGRGFGMPVQHLQRASAPTDELSTAVGWDELLGTSDVLVAALPSTPQTRGILDAAALARLRRTATVVNVGRGDAVVEADLLAALRTGALHSAGLDVLTDEPRSDPADPVLHVPGLVVLPHVGSASHATRRAMTRLAVRNLAAVLSGAPALTPVAGVV